MTDLPGARMAAEIAEQPEALARLLAGPTGYADAAARLRALRPHTVVLAARGTSDHAALHAKYLIEVSLGLPVALASPSTFTVYGARPDYSGVAWIAVSQSGGSPDLVESTAVARECGALTLAVTNSPESPLAAAAEISLDVAAGPELAVAATKTYTSQLLALWLLVDHWRGGDGSAAAPVPDRVAAALEATGVEEAALRHRYATSMVTTARGYSYATAREAALKLMETSYFAAQAFSGADLLHGPLAMVHPDLPVLAVVGHGAGGRAMTPTLERLAERGADLTVVGAVPAGLPATASIEVPGGVGEELSPVLEIVPLQRLAHRLALVRRLDPDAPRGLAKVTSTR